METQETPELTRMQKVGNFCKENWKPLAGVAGAIALKVGLAVLETRRENRKTEAYIDALETRTANQAEALGLNALESDFMSPLDNDE